MGYSSKEPLNTLDKNNTLHIKLVDLKSENIKSEASLKTN
jgi:hypothetical protein